MLQTIWLESSPKINLVTLPNSLETCTSDHPISNHFGVHLQPKFQITQDIILIIKCISKMLPCRGINNLLYWVTSTLPHKLENILHAPQRLCRHPKPLNSTWDKENNITLSLHLNKLTPHLNLMQGLIWCNFHSPDNNRHLRASKLLIPQIK